MLAGPGCNTGDLAARRGRGRSCRKCTAQTGSSPELVESWERQKPADAWGRAGRAGSARSSAACCKGTSLVGLHQYSLENFENKYYWKINKNLLKTLKVISIELSSIYDKNKINLKAVTWRLISMYFIVHLLLVFNNY